MRSRSSSARTKKRLKRLFTTHSVAPRRMWSLNLHDCKEANINKQNPFRNIIVTNRWHGAGGKKSCGSKRTYSTTPASVTWPMILAAMRLPGERGLKRFLVSRARDMGGMPVYSFSSMSSPPFGAFEEKQDIDGNRKGISVSGDACAGGGVDGDS